MMPCCGFVELIGNCYMPRIFMTSDSGRQRVSAIFSQEKPAVLNLMIMSDDYVGSFFLTTVCFSQTSTLIYAKIQQ